MTNSQFETDSKSTLIKKSLDLKSVIATLNKELYEKDEAVRLCLLAALAGESVFMLGPPGTAKSMISRNICETISSKEKYFEYLMNQFSTPDEIFGPVSLKALEKDEYKRIVDGFLPKAEVAFLDEIWKAGPAIQNTLLTILNEKKFHNGKEVIKVPLKAFFAASNELPAKNCGLEALFDRFLIRIVVNPIEDKSNFNKLLEFTWQQEKEQSQKLNIADYQDGGKYFDKINAIEIPDTVLNVIHSIRNEIQVQNEKIEKENDKSDNKEDLFYVSDRRWKKIAHLLKTSAFANHRKEVDLMDLQLISYCIWSTEKQRQLADDIVQKCIKQNGIEYSSNIEELEEVISDYSKTVYERFYKYTPAKKEETITQEHNGFIYTKIMYDNEECWISDRCIYSKEFEYCKERYIYDLKISDKKADWSTESSSYYWNQKNYRKTAELLKTKAEPEKYKKNNEVFNSYATYLPLAKSSDNDYNRIFSAVNTELTKLSEFENKKGVEFKQNLFTNPKYKTVIMNKISVEKRKLEDAIVCLKKIKDRYTK